MSISSEAAALPSAGGTATITVATAPECAWTAAVQAAWIVALRPDRGQGPAALIVEAAPNPGPPRSATVTVAEQALVVRQASGCTYAVEPLSVTASAQGGEAVVTIGTHEGCVWTALSQVPWITITDGGSGAGAGAVTLAIDSNATPPRQGTVSVAGVTVTIDQASGCGYTVAPATVNVPAAASNAQVSVSTAAGCTWSAVSLSPWITLLSTSSGIGSATVEFRADGNVGPARTGSLMVEGQVVTVQQAQGCTYAINPTTLSFGVIGGASVVSIATPPGCAWSASTTESWIQMSPRDGVGSGSLIIGVAPSFSRRTGTVTIGGQRLTIRQNLD